MVVVGVVVVKLREAVVVVTLGGLRVVDGRGHGGEDGVGGGGGMVVGLVVKVMGGDGDGVSGVSGGE